MRLSCVYFCLLCACVGEPSKFEMDANTTADAPIVDSSLDSATGMDTGAPTDAGPDSGSTVFCAMNPTAKFCEDFDLGVLRPNWSATGNAVQVAAMMPQSPPNNGRVNTPMLPINGTADSTIFRTVDATGAMTWRVQARVRFDSYAQPDAGMPFGTPRVLQLNFNAMNLVHLVVQPWSGNASCFATAKGSPVMFTNNSVGFAKNFWHAVSIEVKKSTMYTATCTIDQTTIAAANMVDFAAPANNVSFSVGLFLPNSVGHPIGATQFSFDDILFFTQ
jgi:hypothetical protein